MDASQSDLLHKAITYHAKNGQEKGFRSAEVANRIYNEINMSQSVSSASIVDESIDQENLIDKKSMDASSHHPYTNSQSNAG